MVLSNKVQQRIFGNSYGRAKELRAKGDLQSLSPEEEAELDNYTNMIKGGLSEGKHLASEPGALSELRANLEFAGSDKSAKAIGDAILKKHGIPGRIIQLEKDGKVTNQFAIYDDAAGKIFSLNPKGFDISDIAAGVGQAGNFVPAAASIAGAVAGGPLGGLGAGFGNIAGEALTSGAREGLEEMYAPEHQGTLAHIGDFATNVALGGIGGNLVGNLAGKGLGGAAKFADDATRGAISKGAGETFKAATRGVGEVFGNVLKPAAEGVASVSAKLMTPGVREGLTGFQNALYEAGKNPVLAFAAGAEKITESIIEQGTKQGLSNTEIRDLLQKQMDDYKFQIDDIISGYQKATTEFANAKGQLGQVSAINKDQVDAFNSGLQGYVDKAFDEINTRQSMLVDKAINEYSAGYKAQSSQTLSQISSLQGNLKQIDDDLFSLQKITKFDSPEVQKQLFDIQKRYRPVDGKQVAEPAMPELTSFEPINTDVQNSKAAVGKKIFDRVSSSLKSGMQEESASYNQALAAAQQEQQPLQGVGDAVLDIVNDITTKMKPLAGNDARSVQQGLLRDINAKNIQAGQPSGQDLLQLSKNITETLQRDDLTKGEKATLYNIRGRLISDTGEAKTGPSIFRQVADQSPAAKLFIETNADRIARNDALTPFVTGGIVNDADLTTGSVARRENTDIDAFNAYKDLIGKNSPDNPTVQLLNQYTGIDDSLKGEFADAYARDVLDAAKGDPAKLANLQFNEEFRNVANQVPGVNEKITQYGSEASNLKNQELLGGYEKKVATSQAEQEALDTLYGKKNEVRAADQATEESLLGSNIDFKNEKAKQEYDLNQQKKLGEDSLAGLQGQSKKLGEDFLKQTQETIPQNVSKELQPERTNLETKFGGAEAGLKGLDLLTQKVNSGGQVNLQEATDILNASDASPEVRKNIFNKIIAGDLGKAASTDKGYVNLASDFANKPKYAGSDVPEQFSPFGAENVKPVLNSIQDVGQKQQSVLDAESRLGQVPSLQKEYGRTQRDYLKQAEALTNELAGGSRAGANNRGGINVNLDLGGLASGVQNMAQGGADAITSGPTANMVTTPAVQAFRNMQQSDRRDTALPEGPIGTFNPDQGGSLLPNNQVVQSAPIVQPATPGASDYMPTGEQASGALDQLLKNLNLGDLSRRVQAAGKAFVQ